MTSSFIENEGTDNPERMALIDLEAAARLEDLLFAKDAERNVVFADVARWPSFPSRFIVFFIILASKEALGGC